MRDIRTLRNYAIDSNLLTLDKYPFWRYKIKKEKTKPRVLTLDELRDLRTMNMESY